MQSGSEVTWEQDSYVSQCVMGVHVARDCVKVIKWGFLSRICFLFVQVVLNNLIPDHKGSMQDVFMSAHRHPEHDTATETLLGGYDNWDSEYYIFIAERGYSVYERTMAFFPLYPSLMRLLASTILFPLSFLVPLRSLLLISGALINLVSFPLATSALYLLTLEVTRNDVMSLLVAAVFCLNPASVFMSAAYTECLFVMFTFSGVLAMEKRSPWVASVLFAFATATRANGMVLCGFIAYYHSAIILQSLLDGRSPMIVTATAAFKRFTTAAIQCLIVVLPFAIFQYYGYLLYCSRSGVEDIPPAWCSWRLPLAYSYIQEHYWDVGFLRYYAVKQVPNFLLATPIVVLSLYCIWRYFMGDCREELGSTRLRPYVFHVTFLLLFGVLNIHIQILTRFVCSSTPVIYWFAADALAQSLEDPDLEALEESKSSGAARMLAGIVKTLISPSSDWASKLIVTYFLLYVVLGYTLHCNFYPWT